MFNSAQNYTPLPKTEMDDGGGDMKYFFIPFAVIVFFGAILLGGYWYYRSKALESVSKPTPAVSAHPTPTDEDDDVEVVEEAAPTGIKPSVIAPKVSPTIGALSPEDINLGTDDASLKDLETELQNL